LTVHERSDDVSIIVSDDSALLDIPLIHRFLSEESTWARHIPYETVEKAIRNSLCFGAYENGAQVGFARVVTDGATYGYLCDVFTIATHRGKGISRLLLDAILVHPDIQGLRRFNLATTTAPELYAKFGWKPLAMPQIHMEKYVPDIYTQRTG
jgi:GNAT superfamily N-acetyltransferase